MSSFEVIQPNVGGANFISTRAMLSKVEDSMLVKGLLGTCIQLTKMIKAEF